MALPFQLDKQSRRLTMPEAQILDIGSKRLAGQPALSRSGAAGQGFLSIQHQESSATFVRSAYRANAPEAKGLRVAERRPLR